MDPEIVVSGNTLEELCENAGIPLMKALQASNAITKCAHKGEMTTSVCPAVIWWQWTPAVLLHQGRWVCRHQRWRHGGRPLSRVIDEDSNPIPGLYAAGVDAGNPCGGINWSMPGGFSNSHIFTAGRYTVIHALTGDMTPKKPQWI